MDIMAHAATFALPIKPLRRRRNSRIMRGLIDQLYG
jgi:hypothetical protein